MSKTFKSLISVILGFGFVGYLITLSENLGFFYIGIVFILFAVAMVIPEMILSKKG